ncbi:hypothetical protein [Algivirga pacifica]|uniref:STAS/SEC14 domain-containing protein n=1 Tax=Algivirga pacifica TaxID=1162670 RepID=A0ABP9DMY9_9BACT
MKTIYKSKFSEHLYDDATATIYSDWFKETESMNEEDFRTEMQEWVNAFEACKPKYLFDRCVDFSYPISPEEQVWMAKLLNPAWVALGLQKYAHIVPEELFSEVSVEQTFEEFFNMKLPNQYPIVNFSNKEEALEWLYD